MDGPKVETTVADLFKKNETIFMGYHVISAGWDVLGTAGAIAGLSAYGLGLRKYPLLVTVGTSSLVGGLLGSSLGLTRMAITASKGDDASPPWNKEGVEQRVNGLSHNFKVRVLDKSSWTGIALASGALVLSGGPAALGFSRGALGVAQALSLGSAAGGISAFGCIAASERDSSSE